MKEVADAMHAPEVYGFCTQSIECQMKMKTLAFTMVKGQQNEDAKRERNGIIARVSVPTGARVAPEDYTAVTEKLNDGVMSTKASSWSIIRRPCEYELLLSGMQTLDKRAIEWALTQTKSTIDFQREGITLTIPRKTPEILI